VEAFQDLVAQLDYPMLIVTAATDGERAGCLVGFSTQCSMDPARFLVCLSKRNHTFRVARHADVLVVHFLAPADYELSVLFGEQTGDAVDKFARCAWTPGPGAAPVLDGTRGWFAGRVLARHDLGDHVGFVLDPFAGERRHDGAQLGFQAVREMEPGHPA
jgi:flavin reductase (DIM6/NTAB) family NADH-FMN oxidoreductase RutF